MSKAKKVFIALCVFAIGLAIIYLDTKIITARDWVPRVIGIIGFLIVICAAIYIKGLYPGDRWPKNFNNKDWE